MSTGSSPVWKRFDTGPEYAAFLQQAGGASILPLTTASSVELIAKNTGASIPANVATSLVIKGAMTIASAAQGYVTYAWGASDLILADVYNVEYEITWQDGTSESVPNDSYDQFICFPDLENA